jgi:Tfp pilus assembly protein PilN
MSALRTRHMAIGSVVAATAVLPEHLRGRKDLLAWRPEPSRSQSAASRRILGSLALILLVASAFAAEIAPALRLRIWSRGVSRQLAHSAPARAALASGAAELARIDRTLKTANAFRARRGTTTAFLGQLAELLPESTAITTLHVDSSEATLVAIAPRVTELLSALESVDSANGPRISGTIAREMIAGSRLERATFRIKRVRPRQPSVAPSPARAR